MGPKFGTSGLRGLVVELTDDLVADHVRAFLASCDVGAALYLGCDLRDSSPHLMDVVATTARGEGFNVVECGALPTPALALAAEAAGAGAGAGAVMVTGSHIPADRNGLKFYTSVGEITKTDETAILSARRRPAGMKTALRSNDHGASARFADRYVTAFGADALSGLRIGVYTHSSVSRDLMLVLLVDLGATVSELGRSDEFIPVDTEAVDAATRSQLRDWAAGGAFDAIVWTDGDADRPLLTDATGSVIPGDVVGQIAAQLLEADVVVTPVSSNTGVDLCGQFARVVRTKIGSPFVIAGMQAHEGARVVGYEANGGFMLGFDAMGPAGLLPRLVTRDFLVPLLATLVAARAAGCIAARVAIEPTRFTATDRLECIPTEHAASQIARLTADTDIRRTLLTALGLSAVHSIDTTDGLRMTSADGTVLHMRPSGNAPELRIYVEADDAKAAQNLLVRAMNALGMAFKVLSRASAVGSAAQLMPKLSAQRILYLSPYFWPEEVGSASYATELAGHLQGVGYAVQVEAFRPHYPDAAQFSEWADGARDYESRNGLSIRRARARPRGTGGFKARIANDLGYLRHVLAGVVAGRFRGTDVVVAYVPSIFTLYAAFAVRLFTRARIIAIVHDIESGLAAALGITKGGAMLRLMRLTERMALNRADHVIVLTEGMREELQAVGCRRPISVLPIWASVSDWRDPPASVRQVLMYSGNFGKKQNLDQLLPLLERLDRDGVQVDIVLRGYGSEHARIADEVIRRGIGNVRFLPFAPADAFVSALQDAHIHLVPQARNVANYALPSKLISIMAVGRPFICIADSGSPLDLLASVSGAGLCIAPGDEDSLFRAVAALVADPARQDEMGRKGQAHVRAHMDQAHVLSCYDNIIRASLTVGPVSKTMFL